MDTETLAKGKITNNVHTPLRYPGGKSFIAGFLREIYAENGINTGIYAEPYAGGAGAAISLLLSGTVNHIYLNDANFAVYAFWKAILEDSNRFISMVEKTPVTLEVWKKNREILVSKKYRSRSTDDILKLGFAMFFLNRCNRSGILNAGPIGGRTEELQEAATYKIDARFNKETLLEKIERIVELKKCISVYTFDALAFLNRVVNRLSVKKKNACLVYLDPPYYEQGGNLYLNYYDNAAHESLRNFLLKDRDYRWILSYDNVDPVKKMYQGFQLFEFDLFYSAHKSKEGKELLTHSKNLILPQSNEIYRIRRSGKRIVNLVPIEDVVS